MMSVSAVISPTKQAVSRRAMLSYTSCSFHILNRQMASGYRSHGYLIRRLAELINKPNILPLPGINFSPGAFKTRYK